MINQTISHYRITAKLGEGGMGVVYRAEDTKLHRTVALKFLPSHLAKEGPERERFFHEARAYATLNHPNVTTIYEVDEADGQVFISMEIVQGDTLSDLIERKQIQMKDAINIAIQIAEGLAAAHAGGVVHRDIKPSNILLTKEKQVKITDFGLAKLRGVSKLTRSGSTLGTLAYMSPEQAKGEPADERSDIFSFGVVLFEMLSGSLAFRGEHEAAMVYSIVNEEPRDITRLVPGLSPIVVNVIQRCLEKDPDDRFHHFDDISADLKRSQKKTTKITASPAVLSVEQPQLGDARKPRPRLRTYFYIFGSILCILAIALWLFLRAPSTELNPNPAVVPLRLSISEYGICDISRDGKWLVFSGADGAGKPDAYLMFLDNNEIRKVTSDSALTGIACFSPDGGRIAYSRASRPPYWDIAVVNVLGGTPKVITRSGGSPRWHPNGDRIGFIRTPIAPGMSSKSGKLEIWTVNPDGRDERLVYTDTIGGVGGPFSFDWSPEGNRIVFARTTGVYQELVIHNITTKEEKTITNDKAIIYQVRWAQNGMVLFSSQRSGQFNIWMTDDEGSHIEPITRSEGDVLGVTVSSAGNRLVYMKSEDLRDVWRLHRETSELKRLTSQGKAYGLYSTLAVSGDASEISFTQVSEKGFDIVKTTWDGTDQNTLVGPTKDGVLVVLRYSPDDQFLLYTNALGHSDTNRVMVIPSVGLSPAREICRGYGGLFWWDQHTIGVARSSGTWLVDIATGQERLFYKESTYVVPVLNKTYAAPFSDLYDFGGKPLGYVVRLDKNGDWVKGTERRYLDPGAAFATWSIQNDALYVREKDGSVWSIDYLSGRRQRVPGFGQGMRPTNITVSQDGRELLFVNSEVQSRLTMIDRLFVR